MHEGGLTAMDGIGPEKPGAARRKGDLFKYLQRAENPFFTVHIFANVHRLRYISFPVFSDPAAVLPLAGGP